MLSANQIIQDSLITNISLNQLMTVMMFSLQVGIRGRKEICPPTFYEYTHACPVMPG